MLVVTSVTSVTSVTVVTSVTSFGRCATPGTCHNDVV